MQEEKLQRKIQQLAKNLPRFEDGRIDHSKSKVAPVVTIFMEHGDKILLLKRSQNVGTYQGLWQTVAGYLDELRPLHEKIFEELEEELNLTKELIKNLYFGEPYEYFDKDIDKTWLIHPVLALLSEKPRITLDWEHTDSVWIDPSKLHAYKIVPMLDETLHRALEARGET